MTTVSRRVFLHRAVRTGFAVGAAGVLQTGRAPAAAAADAKSAAPAAANPRIAVFTKSFQDLSIAEVCSAFKQIGVDGLDLTVRGGGHIAPADVTEQLPQAMTTARAQGLEILQLTTGITEPDADAERILAAAARAGIRRIKMGYFDYKPFGTLARQLDDVRKKIARVAQLARKFEVLPCVHIHSGSMIPSHGTMLYELIRDMSPQDVGAYVDTLHMTKEGGGDGWRQGLDLLAPWIALCAVKNCRWEEAGRDEHGQLRWKTVNVPVADGICPVPEFTKALKELKFAGIYSLHSEYKGGHSFQDLDTKGCLRQTDADFRFFKPLVS